MQTKLLFLILMLASFNVSLSQNIDSLEVIVNELLSPEPIKLTKYEIRSINDLAELYKKKDINKSMFYAKKGLEYASLLGELNNEELDALIILSNSYNKINQIDSAIYFLEEGISKYDDEKQDGVLLENIGNLYQYQGFNHRAKGDFIKAAECFDRAYKIFDKGGFIQNQMAAKYNQANLLTRLESYEQAEKAFNTLLDITDNKKVHAAVYSSLGILSSKQNKLKEAVRYYKECIKLEDYLGEPELTYLNIGITKRKMGDYQSSKENLLKAEKICKSRNNKRNLLKIYNNLSNLFIEYEELDLAVKYLELSQSMVKSDNLEELTSIYDQKYRIYEKQGKWKQAFKDLELRNVYRDSIESKEKLIAVAEIQTKYETEKKENENLLLKKDKELQAALIHQQRNSIIGIIAGLILLGILSYFFYRQSKERKKSNLILKERNDQIKTLHKELSHRVKNNLFFMSSLLNMQGKSLEEGKAKDALNEGSARLEVMSLLHRKLGIDQSSQKINVGDYINEICSYLKMSLQQKNSFPEISVDSDEIFVDPDYAMRLGIIINELVTNSIKHAFVNQNDPKIHTTISNISEEDYLVKYSDNGIGFTDEIDQKSSSLGMKLIKILTNQLKGSMSIANTEGASVTFVFSKGMVTQ